MSLHAQTTFLVKIRRVRYNISNQMPDAMCLFHGSAFQIYTKFVQDSDFQYLQNNIDEVCIGIGEDEDMRIVGTKKFQYFQSRWYLSNNYIN